MQDLNRMKWDEKRAKPCEISSLVGNHIVHVDDLEIGSGEVRFFCPDGTAFSWRHDQNCCESVRVEDIVGDVDDLIGAVVLEAREETNADDPIDYIAKRAAEDPAWDRYRESYTWTFYIIQTNKGAVTVRWLGESNGYYSEDVSMVRMGN